MKAEMTGYSLHLAEKDNVQESAYDTALALTRDRLAQLQLQQDNNYEYLEKDIYTKERCACISTRNFQHTNKTSLDYCLPL